MLPSSGEHKSSLLRIATVIVTLLAVPTAIVVLILHLDDLKRRFWPTPAEAPRPRETVTLADALDVMIRDQEAADASTRGRRRYLTLLHLHNEPAVNGDNLAQARQRLTDLGSYLSSPGRPVLFRSLDGAQTVFVADLDRLSSEPERFWEQVMRQDPYCLKSTDPALKAKREQLEKLTGTEVPFVRGDWLAQALLQSPLDSAPGRHPPGAALPATLQQLASAYSSDTLDLDRAARELGLTGAQRLREVLQKSSFFSDARWGLAPLLEGKAISRAVWESRGNGDSPFQALSVELDLGYPFVPAAE